MKKLTFLILIFSTQLSFGQNAVKQVKEINQQQKVKSKTGDEQTQGVKQLKEVTIKSTKRQIERKLDKITINVEHSSLAVGNSALDILSNAPGVTIANDGTIQLHGKSGVNVMLDGKLTYLSGAELTNLLRQTNASQIQTIELIAQPSSKYDAAGSAGLINITLKRKKEFGTNGTLNVSAAVGKYLKANTGITLNNRTAHFNFYGNYAYADNKRFGKLDLNRLITIPNQYSNINQHSNTFTNNYNHTYKVRVDYLLNQQHTIGVAVNGYSIHQNELNKVSSLIRNEDLNVNAISKANNTAVNTYNNNAYTLNYSYAIDTSGQQLTVDLDLLNYHNTEDELFNNRFLNNSDFPPDTSILLRSHLPVKLAVRAVKVDYISPLAKNTSVEMGLKSSKIKSDNNFIFEDNSNGQWIINPNRTNGFLYDETINAGYINLNHSWGATALRAGIRAEHTVTTGQSTSIQQLIERRYFNLFPSVFVSHQWNNNHSFGLNFSRRIDRPNYGSLNPFIYLLDLYTYRQGNPYLKPQYTNSATLSYQLLQRYSLSVGYSDTKDVIAEVVLPDSTKGLFRKPENLSRQRTLNLTISAPMSVTTFWKMDNNLSLYDSHYSSSSILGVAYQQRKLAYNFKSNQQLQFNQFARLDLAANYQSDQLYGTSYLKAYFYLDLGLSKQFFKGRFDLKLSVKDVFNSRSQTIYSNLPAINYQLYEKEETRLFAIGLTYSFGGKAIKGARRNAVGIEEERNRLGIN